MVLRIRYVYQLLYTYDRTPTKQIENFGLSRLQDSCNKGYRRPRNPAISGWTLFNWGLPYEMPALSNPKHIHPGRSLFLWGRSCQKEILKCPIGEKKAIKKIHRTQRLLHRAAQCVGGHVDLSGAYTLQPALRKCRALFQDLFRH